MLTSSLPMPSHRESLDLPVVGHLGFQVGKAGQGSASYLPLGFSVTVAEIGIWARNLFFPNGFRAQQTIERCGVGNGFAGRRRRPPFTVEGVEIASVRSYASGAPAKHQRCPEQTTPLYPLYDAIPK